MMKKLLVGLVIILITSSCGSLQCYVNKDSNYSKENPITIMMSKDDDSGTLGELRYLLQSNGYKLMSYTTAKKSINLDINYSNNTEQHELTSTISPLSPYMIELDYSYYHDVIMYYYTTFSANITDMRTGEIIMSANFRGDRSVKSVLKELVLRMDEAIK